MKYWISMKLMHASFFIHEGTRILSFFWWGLLKRVKYSTTPVSANHANPKMDGLIKSEN